LIEILVIFNCNHFLAVDTDHGTNAGHMYLF
jgi:hypothetical protein